MSYKVTIKLANDTTKEITIGSDVDLPEGMGLTAIQISSLLGLLQALTIIMGNESWKSVEVELE